MKRAMMTCEISYRRTVSAIGGALLSFSVLMALSGLLISWFGDLLALLETPDPQRSLLFYFFYTCFYLLTFLVPIACFGPVMRKSGREYRPVRVAVRPSWLILPILFGGVALIWAQSHINAMAIGVFPYAHIGTPMSGYAIVLELLVTAMLPAFCEELLFRGVVMENLLPYGRQHAILISSFLFAVAHQSVGQMLYAFAAGILLGLLYERTGSIWNCVLLHLVNNFASVIILVLSAQFGQNMQIGYLLVECGFYLLGLISLVILVFLIFGKRLDLSGGVFGKSVDAWDGYAECRLSREGRIKAFLRPSIFLFLLLCASAAIIRIVQSFVL